MSHNHFVDFLLLGLGLIHLMKTHLEVLEPTRLGSLETAFLVPAIQLCPGRGSCMSLSLQSLSLLPLSLLPLSLLPLSLLSLPMLSLSLASLSLPVHCLPLSLLAWLLPTVTWLALPRLDMSLLAWYSLSLLWNHIYWLGVLEPASIACCPPTRCTISALCLTPFLSP